jgi:hypothetical protein
MSETNALEGSALDRIVGHVHTAMRVVRIALAVVAIVRLVQTARQHRAA